MCCGDARRLAGHQVLVITAQGLDRRRRSSAMKLGAYDFIKKPFELQEILPLVRNALHASSWSTGRILGARGRRAETREMIFASDAMRSWSRRRR
jgi:DNA-binding NtrC family response regulator